MTRTYIMDRNGKKRETVIIGRDLFKMIELKEKGYTVLWTGEDKICLVNKHGCNEKEQT